MPAEDARCVDALPHARGAALAGAQVEHAGQVVGAPQLGELGGGARQGRCVEESSDHLTDWKKSIFLGIFLGCYVMETERVRY